MDVVNQGIVIALLFILMNSYVYLTQYFISDSVLKCSSEGQSFFLLIERGSLVMNIFNIIAIIYVKLKQQKLKTSDNLLLSLFNFCWILLAFSKSYGLILSSVSECETVALLQAITFYLHLTTETMALIALCSYQAILRIAALPANGLSLFLILIDGQINSVDDNVYYLICLCCGWALGLGVPYNLIMQITQRISQPYRFISIVTVLIQIPILLLLYFRKEQNVSPNSKSAYSILEIHFVISIIQIIMNMLYHIFIRNKEEEKKNNKDKEQISLILNKSKSVITTQS